MPESNPKYFVAYYVSVYYGLGSGVWDLGSGRDFCVSSSLLLNLR